MYRAVLHRRAACSLPHRNFASTVLLSRTWEHETVVTLRQEAKIRGLSTKGKKSVLISRIQEFEEARAAPSSHPVAPVASRNVSSSATPPQATPPGIPPIYQRADVSVTPDFLVKVPDLSQDGPDAPVQAPFLPDFWDSSPKPEATEPSHPKFYVVSGSVTHPDGGPTYNLEKPSEVEGVEQAISEVHGESSGEHGFFRDLADDIGLPRTIHVSKAISDVVHAAKEQCPDIHAKSRPLNDVERKGVWVLLSLLAGSWIIGGWVNRTPHEEHGVEDDKH